MLELHLPITDLFGNCLEVDVPIALTGRKAPREVVAATSGKFVEFLERTKSKV